MVRVTVLGSGDAFGAGGRAHSAYLVEAPGTTFLLDCGPSILQTLQRVGARAGDIDFVLLSHLHGDHFGGLPFLFLDYKYREPRTRPFHIYGPPETERRVCNLFAALYERTARETLPFALEFTELPADASYTLRGIDVLSVAVPHTDELVCYALRVAVAGQVIFYSGDTGWTDKLLEHARGADLFLCECSTYETRMAIHLAYPEVAARAADFGCRRLVLTHLGEEPLRRRSSINLECAEDGMVIELGAPRPA